MDADGSKENHRKGKAIELRERKRVSSSVSAIWLFQSSISIYPQSSNFWSFAYWVLLVSLFVSDRSNSHPMATIGHNNLNAKLVGPSTPFRFLSFFLQILIPMIFYSLPFVRFFSGTWVLANPASFCALSRVNFSNSRFFVLLFIWFLRFDWGRIVRI